MLLLKLCLFAGQDPNQIFLGSVVRALILDETVERACLAKSISKNCRRSISQIFETLVEVEMQRWHVPLPVARSRFDFFNAKSASLFLPASALL
jgi:hypothetical protein